MQKKIKTLLMAMATTILSSTVYGAGETILYVPQDDRPVSLLYTVATAEDAGYHVITPPEYLISGSNFEGQADRIWKWVEDNAGRADAMVVSTDTLIYGGLVDSRKHYLPLSTLESRVQRLKLLHKRFSHVPIYGFGTIMRSPRASGGGVEPAYYATYGPTIFRIAALQDKLDSGKMTEAEGGELLSLQSTVPIEYLQDWFDRRQKNMIINKALIDATKEGVFSYFALGHDDTSSLSQSAMESRYLSKYSKSLPLTKYGSFPGADQLGLLLMARYHVDLHHLHPTFEVIYPLGGGADTMPHYEDQSVGKTIREHIIAVGGSEKVAGKPTVLLAVNTPLGTITGESEAFTNLPYQSKSNQDFIRRIERAVEVGIPVSVADISYSNGSDNTLLYGLYRDHLLYKLDAYNGWNTASNTVGYAVAQGILGIDMSKKAHDHMLTQQYLDNWAYQANIRKDIYRLQDKVRQGIVRYSDPLNEKLEPYMQERMQDFAEAYLHVDPRTIKATFPWHRLFEVKVEVYNEPIVPLEKEVREAKEKEEAALLAQEEGHKQEKVGK